MNFCQFLTDNSKKQILIIITQTDTKIKCTLCQVQKVCVLVNIAIFIWIVLLAALSYPFAYPAVGVKVTAGEAEPMP